MRALSICAALVVATASPLALAQSDQKATAEKLFEEGRRLLVEKRYADACPKLAESQRLDPSIGTALYLGACYEKTNKTASAWAMFREAQELCAREGDAKRAGIARARAAALEPQLQKLVIAVAPAARTPGLSVTRDGVPVGEVLWGAEVPVDPGRHRVEASAPNKKPFAAELDVRSAPRIVFEIPALADDPGPPPPPAPAPAPAPVGAPPPRAEAPVPDTTGDTQRTLGIAAFAGGLVGLGVGVAFTLRTSSLVGDARSHGCDTSASPAQCPDDPGGRAGLASLDDARKTWRPLSIVAFVVGGALVATGGVLFFTAPRAKSTRAVSVVPFADARGGGVTVGGAL